jgi:hypothetical protein
MGHSETHIGKVMTRKLKNKTALNKIAVSSCIAATVLLLSCRKEAPELPEATVPVTTDQVSGVPQQPGTISAYLYAGYRKSLQPSNTFTQLVYNAFLGDPPRDLSSNFDRHTEMGRNTKTSNLPNVNVGTMFFNGRQLSANGAVFYMGGTNSGSGPVNLDYALWESEGNKTFKPLSLTVARGFPSYTGPVTTFTVRIKQGLTIDMNAMFSNYDSASVKLSTQNFPVVSVHKRGSVNSPVITFSKSELEFIKNYYSGLLQVCAFNYSHKTIEDKVHLIELGGRVELSAVIDSTSK